MIARFLFIFGAVVWFASAAFGGNGIYQQTKDGKTTVWNDDPKPGDVAAWAGARDHDGYAVGFGTVTWYKQHAVNGSTKSILYARYFGKMVRGKFDGPVNVHSKGKTGHALFVDGSRTTRWVTGPTLSRSVAEARIESAKRENATEPANVKRAARAEPEVPAVGPPPTVAKAENSQLSTLNAQPPTPEPEERVRQEAETGPARPTPNSSVGAALAAEVNRPAEQIIPTPELKEPQAPAEGPAIQKSEVKEQKPEIAERAIHKPAAGKKPKAEVDNSLRLLAGPPSSLGAGPIDEASSIGAKTEAASSPGAARLTKEEVVDLADAEARRRGYEPGEYQRLEPQYNVADETWSLLYDQKPDANGMAEVGKNFSVTIDDKTKGTVFVPVK